MSYRVLVHRLPRGRWEPIGQVYREKDDAERLAEMFRRDRCWRGYGFQVVTTRHRAVRRAEARP